MDVKFYTLIFAFRGLPWIIAAFALILLILFVVLFIFAAKGFGGDTVSDALLRIDSFCRIAYPPKNSIAPMSSICLLKIQ
jgi:hypothetical protein